MESGKKARGYMVAKTETEKESGPEVFEFGVIPRQRQRPKKH
jgi:hypothetical protein